MFYSFPILFVLLFFVTYIAIKLFIKNASKFGLIDIPNHRSVHKKPIAVGAGIVFSAFFLIIFFLIHYFIPTIPDGNYIYLALFIIYLVGVYDDLFNINAQKKFFFIIMAAAIAYYNGFAIENLGTYFGYKISLGFVALPFTIFAIVGFTNALNLTDGLDGLAASISITMLTSLMYIGYRYSDSFLMVSSLAFISILTAFLLLNWSPAKVFMGDSGSLFLGFVISLLFIYALRYITPTSILFLAAIPLLDTFTVIRRRMQRHQSIFIADRNHIHHILLRYKGDVSFTVVSLFKLQIFLSFIGIQCNNQSDLINLLSFLLLFSIFFALFDPRMHYRRKRTTKIH